ncbi:alpha-galactosidase [Microbacterium sp. H1-D42]|uniref:alpha-galactosidase n=1 Tax=Microbacterium sp. H1-D42 TaxID=2925844 RepID=UPI001F53A56D|nr:alpha-galactosidase [Microbacterium sp. H1-D42]UNK70456.1 alpha-galactosidase [Microbacterium sp. H1-D42]
MTVAANVMQITRSASADAWFLETENTLYAIGISGEGIPTQRYWGPRLPDADRSRIAVGMRSRSLHSHGSRPSEVEEEVLVGGGSRWGVAGLNIVLPGADRAPEIAVESDEIVHDPTTGEATLRLTLRDSKGALAVTLCYRLRAGTDVIERWAELSLASSAPEDALLHRADSANWFIEDQDDYRYSAVSGYWAGETQLERKALPVGELTFTSRTGTTSHGANPWVMLDDGTATEDVGLVRSIALGWSGTWRLTVQRRAEGGVSVSTGLGHDGVVQRLHPGSTLTTPSSFGQVSGGGFGAASRGWHRFVREQLRPGGDQLNPVLYNSWEATEFAVTEEGQVALARQAAALGVELFVVDDGWFSTRTDDRGGLGDWWPDPRRFPDGLRPLRDEIAALGMQFGLWVEPEMVNPRSELYSEHPDWVLHFDGRHRAERRNQLVLNFARDDVRVWALEWLDRLVEENGIDFLKWDMNRPFTQAGWPENPSDQDSLWVEHTRGVTDIMRRLREAHPHLRIESCAGGGGRVDLAMAALVDEFWTSDNTDAIDRQPIQHGFSQLYPAIGMTNWVTDSPNPLTFREVPLEYRFHVAMAGALGIGGDLSGWSAEELETSTALIAQYKRIREVVQLGDLHRLGGMPGRDRSAVQYVRDDRVVVFCYEPRRSLDRSPRHLTLRGLEDDARYRDVATGEEYGGAYLRHRGFSFHEDALVIAANDSLRFSQRDFLSSIVEFVRV